MLQMNSYILPPLSKARVAVDAAFGLAVVARIVKEGWSIGYIATDEHDELWLADAEERGCTVFVTHDTDVEIYAINRGHHVIKVPSNRTSEQQMQSVIARLNRLRKDVA